MKNIAVILSGCGFKDGSEITETVSSLIAITLENASYKCFAPSLDVQTVNHISGKSSEKRNILVEASRISRGNISDLRELNPDEFDALLFPGGFGVALHLCNWAQQGSSCNVESDIEKLIIQFHDASKPIGAICIAPALIARVLGQNGISVTIGNDLETVQEIEKTGAEHINCKVDDYITDRASKIITTPAYMYDAAKPSDVFKGIRGLVRELTEMA